MSAVVVWQSRSNYWSLMAIAGISVLIVAGFVVLDYEILFLASFFLFALPAVPAAQVDAGLGPAIALTAMPIAGYAFSGPGGRAGSLTLANRLLGVGLIVTAVTAVAVVLYSGVRVGRRLRE